MRNGQKVTIYDAQVWTLTGKQGTLTIRERTEWVQREHPLRLPTRVAATGTWDGRARDRPVLPGHRRWAKRVLTAGRKTSALPRHKRRVAVGDGHSRKCWGGLGTQVLVEAGARFVPLSVTHSSWSAGAAEARSCLVATACFDLIGCRNVGGWGRRRGCTGGVSRRRVPRKPAWLRGRSNPVWALALKPCKCRAFVGAARDLTGHKGSYRVTAGHLRPDLAPSPRGQ
jgi:hypothetical protein